ncbi:hypothetical protein JBL43_16430 [Aureibaculum sp. A20]|uniref:Uncharacterized protein n=1 Tax=Aureibaculum flavum TaxID=2795986 RepID=A0ABS0WV36_9FLAO|nr:hypothetical protein [Aureibaculum flavum]MBJ2175842.1 hypothetical protein [Aureibaculum flavum]
MSKKLKIIVVILVLVFIAAIIFLRQTSGIYYKSYSPDGQYSCYAAVSNSFSYDGPFSKFGDQSGKVFVYDEIEKKIVGSAPVEMISSVEYSEWDETSLSSRGGYSIELPRKINSNLITKYQKSTPVLNQWSLTIQGESYNVHRNKSNRLTIKDKNEKTLLKDIKYIAQINNDSLQVLNEKTEIIYLNKHLKPFTEAIITTPPFYGVCGNVSTYSLKIVESNNYYILKKAESFTNTNFDNYKTIDSINKIDVKNIYFLNKKRQLEHDGNFPALEYVIIDFGDSFGIFEEQYGIQYFDHVDSSTSPIKVKRNGLYGYYNSTRIKYLELHPYVFNLAEIKNSNDKKGYIDRLGKEYY